MLGKSSKYQHSPMLNTQKALFYFVDLPCEVAKTTEPESKINIHRYCLCKYKSRVRSYKTLRKFRMIISRHWGEKKRRRPFSTENIIIIFEYLSKVLSIPITHRIINYMGKSFRFWKLYKWFSRSGFFPQFYGEILDYTVKKGFQDFNRHRITDCIHNWSEYKKIIFYYLCV